MKRLLLEIDLHIVVLGLIVSVLFVGFVSTITIVPGTFTALPVIIYCLIPSLVFLEPMILTGTLDRRKRRAHALRYFGVNTLIAVTYGIASGFLIFGILPQKDALRKTTVELRGGDMTAPLPLTQPLPE